MRFPREAGTSGRESSRWSRPESGEALPVHVAPRSPLRLQACLRPGRRLAPRRSGRSCRCDAARWAPVFASCDPRLTPETAHRRMRADRLPVEIRRIRADEGLRLRALRLRALADAPQAFGSTLAREHAFVDSTWHERAAGG